VIDKQIRRTTLLALRADQHRLIKNIVQPFHGRKACLFHQIQYSAVFG
jgi:hypothetical protein